MSMGIKTFITKGGSATSSSWRRERAPPPGHHTLCGRGRDAQLVAAGQAQDRPARFHTSERFFEEVRVPASHMISELNRGFAAMMQRLPQERLQSACANQADARARLDRTQRRSSRRSWAATLASAIPVPCRGRPGLRPGLEARSSLLGKGGQALLGVGNVQAVEGVAFPLES